MTEHVSTNRRQFAKQMASLSLALLAGGSAFAATNPTNTEIKLKNTSGMTARIVFSDRPLYSTLPIRIHRDVTLTNGQSAQFKIPFGLFYVSTFKSGATQSDYGVGRTIRAAYSLEVYDGGYLSGGKHVAVLKIRNA